MKGLVCAGGEATRLGELTRVTNKHLLPVGRWPMIFYPLQLLEHAGVESVLVVTGKGHAGQMIDLLGDGRRGRGRRDAAALARPHVQGADRARRDRPGRRHGAGLRAGREARRRAGRQRLRACRRPTRSRSWAPASDGALIFVKDVPDPENFGVVVYGDDGRVADIVEKAGVVDARYDAPPTNEAVVGLYCFPPDVFDVIAALEPSSRGELEITDVNRHYARQGASTSSASRAGGRTPGSTGSTSPRSAAASTRPAPTDDLDGVERIPLRRSRTTAAGSASSGATARSRSRRRRPTSRSRGAA